MGFRVYRIRLNTPSAKAVGHIIATAATEIAASPHMASPILAVHQRKFGYRGMGGATFQLLHQLTHSKVWRNR